ncbi:MAG: hypothetical protein COA85_08380 [Robiginitomaculum sp.]|nr:MAG: hypothetical protein COA85_08380 [Robiginitomaculum sp.]
MALPNSYTLKVGAITAYFDALLNAEAPERFSIKFLEGLGFKSTNDRLLIGILKELGFLNADGAPQDRYFQFLDKSKSAKIVAEGIREAYSDLFAVNKNAYELDANSAYDKLRTLYRGEKKDSVIKNISKTFTGLCAYADFSQSTQNSDEATEPLKEKSEEIKGVDGGKPAQNPLNPDKRSLSMSSLQYHINIVLPETRDSAVYDAIFKSLRDHLG